MNYEIWANGKLLGRIEAQNIFAAAVIAAQEFFKKPAAWRKNGDGQSGTFHADGRPFQVREIS